MAIHEASNSIAGFYTLSAADILLNSLPDEMAKRLPRYPTLPAARLGRLAIDHRFTGQKLGSALLADAILRAAGSEIAVYAMIVDAKDDAAEAFYRHHGFVGYGSAERMLMAPIAALLSGGGA
jgi:GNAT superfamily N-acetyltransferase